MQDMIAPLRRYADFKGRSRRREFWLFFLFQMIINSIIIGTIIMFSDENNETALAIFAIILVLWFLAMIIPNAAVIVRRMHDQNISGWVGGGLYASMTIFSGITGLVLLIFMCIDGKRGPNQYGPDPKTIEAVKDIFA